MCQDCLPQLNNSVVTGPPGPPGTPGANGTPGRDGVYGGVCAHYKFSDVVTVGGTFPGIGLLKFNSANLVLATRIDICLADINSNDLTAFINTIGIPTSAVKALIRITSKDDESKYEFFKVTGYTSTGTGVSGWAELTVVNIGASLVVPPFNPWIPADDILFCPTLSGETAFNLNNLPVTLNGVNYPVASAGDVFRIVPTDSPFEFGRVGTLTTQEPPDSIRVYKDDLLYCTTANPVAGDEATCGANFFVLSAPRGLVPLDGVNGSSNFMLNIQGNDNAGNIASGANTFGNMMLGNDNSFINDSQYSILIGGFNTTDGARNGLSIGNTNYNYQGNENILIGDINSVNKGSKNILVGTGLSMGNGAAQCDNNIFTGTGNSASAPLINNDISGTGNAILASSSSNKISGTLNTTGGNNNNISGLASNISASSSLVSGGFHQVLANAPSTALYAMVGGSGAQATLGNSLNIGATSAPGSFSGYGSFQSMLIPLAGYTYLVTKPISQYMRLSTSAFPNVNDTLLLTNNMSWDFLANIVIVQKGIGTTHTNTSTIGDYVSYTITGTVNRHAGTTTIHNVKFLDHRNRWIPSASPSSICYRSIYTKSGAATQNNDVYLVQPTVYILNNALTFDFIFPGDAEAMVDLGVLETPRFAVYLANADVPMPVLNTGVITDDGIVKNTITTTTAPPNPPFSGAALSTFTFKNPIVDIFDGSDANGSGYYGGSGFGALATAITDGSTGVEYVGICSGGSYDAGATMTFDTGVATGTCNMSATADHVTSVTTTNGGAGYTNGSNYPLIFTGGGGTGAAAVVNVIGGVFQTPTMTSAGSGYTGVPTVTCTAAGAGNGAAAFTPILKFSVLSVYITAAGLYDNTSIPTVTFAGAGTAQATGNAVLVSQSISSVGPLSGSITVTSGGKGYGVSRPRISIYDGGSTACGAGNGGSFVAEGTIIISQSKYA